MHNFTENLSVVSNFLIIRPPSPPFASRIPPMSAHRRAPISKRSGCRSPPTVSSKRSRACSRAPKACTTGRDDGRKVLDGVAGLWCVNAGHGRKEITEAVSTQLATMEYAPPFQMGHPPGFELANRLVKLAPGDLDHVFFTNSGSESVDTALKIAIALSPRARRRRAAAADRTREGLSRRRLRRHLGRRHGQQPQVLRQRCCRASITCVTRSISSTTRSRAACPSGARISPTIWSAWSRCTTHRRSRP